MPDHYLNVEGARTLNTLWFARVQEAFADAVDQRAIALIHGVAGVGKTYAVKYAIEKCTLPVYRFVFPPDIKMRQISDVLLRRITGVRHREERFLLADTLREILSEGCAVIVIDEMQLLNLESIRVSAVAVGQRRPRHPVLAHPRRRQRLLEPGKASPPPPLTHLCKSVLEAAHAGGRLRGNPAIPPDL